MNNILNKDEISLLKASGKILKQAILLVQESIKDGISTAELDRIAEEFILSKNARPSFKNYFIEGIGNYPSSLCISLNHEVVHGLPSKDKVIHDGDIVSLDLGVDYKGLYSDMAVTVAVGDISNDVKKLLDIAKECLMLGIEKAVVGNRIGDIGAAVQNLAEKHGYGVVRDLVGHGIGRRAHLRPQIPNFGQKGTGEKIVEGMALAIEPMITIGDYKVRQERDGWTIVTADSSLAAHFEHTVVIENGKPVIVTA